jgi:hypothetical protein
VTALLWIALGVGAAAASYLVWRHDLYEREPWWMMLLCGAAGALLAPVCGWIEDRAIPAISPTPSSAVIASVASGVEESARLLALGALALLTRRWFSDALDGVTCGSLVGVGMSVYETGLRLQAGPIEEIGAGEVVRMFSHAVLGGIAGFPLGILTLREGRERFLPALGGCFAAVLALHFLVDWAGLRAAGVRGFEATGTAIVAAAVLAGAVLYGILTAIAAEWSRRQFAPCSPRTLFGWPFAQFLGPPDIPPWCPVPGEDAPPPPSGLNTAAPGATSRGGPPPTPGGGTPPGPGGAGGRRPPRGA